MGANGLPIFYIDKSLFLDAINHCFDNKSQTDPSPCRIKIFILLLAFETCCSCPVRILLVINAHSGFYFQKLIQLGFSEIQTELTKLLILPYFLPTLPNRVKIKIPSMY